MSDHDAHKALTDTARLRILRLVSDEREAEPMSYSDIRMRKLEACHIQASNLIAERRERRLKSFSRFPRERT